MPRGLSPELAASHPYLRATTSHDEISGLRCDLLRLTIDNCVHIYNNNVTYDSKNIDGLPEIQSLTPPIIPCVECPIFRNR
jgi:hypothetical protein